MFQIIKDLFGVKKKNLHIIEGDGTRNWRYKAHCRRTNKAVDGEVKAHNQGEAIVLIKKEGFLPIEVREIKDGND